MGTVIGTKLRALVDARDLSLRDVGRDVGVSYQTVARWLGGVNRPKAAQALALARLLGVSLDYLLDDAQDDPHPGRLTDDERIILRLAAKLTPDEAIRRLMAAEPAVAPPAPINFSRGIEAGGRTTSPGSPAPHPTAGKKRHQS
jgi:transcriptional regulator with XRE-family HTH domain